MAQVFFAGSWLKPVHLGWFVHSFSQVERPDTLLTELIIVMSGQSPDRAV